MSHKSTCLAALIGIALGFGCGRSGPEPAAPKPSADGRKTYTLRGVVRRVDLASGEVTIAHEELPGFMAAMTMPFTLRDRSSLEDVHPGDEVEGPLEVDFEGGKVKDYRLVDLAVTRPSTGQAESGPPGTLGAMFPPPPTLKVGDLVPDFAVTTQDGAPLRLSDLRGQVVAITFIYTRCPFPDFCPALDAKFAEIARRVEADRRRAGRVRLLSVSFDPEHDTPAALLAHARARGAVPPTWTFAVASHEELRKVAGPLGLSYAPTSGEIAHTRSAAVIGPDGRLARLETGRDWTPADLSRTIHALIVTKSD